MEERTVSFGQYQDVYGFVYPDTKPSFSGKGQFIVTTANEGDAAWIAFVW